MDFYNYEKAVYEDTVQAILDNADMLPTQEDDSYDDIFDRWYALLWSMDSVTGNASGSYTFNTAEAEQNLVGNWDLLADALNEFGQNNVRILEKGAEWCDVTIRCYVLPDALSEALENPDVQRALGMEE